MNVQIIFQQPVTPAEVEDRQRAAEAIARMMKRMLSAYASDEKNRRLGRSESPK